MFDWADIVVGSTQNAFDNFYFIAMQLINTHYPLQTVTLTSRDLSFITPAIKTMLRGKNMLMRGGRTAEASALALLISTGIAKQNPGRLVDANTVGSKSMWAKVNEVTGEQRRAMPTEAGLDSAVLNAHYAATSTDGASPQGMTMLWHRLHCATTKKYLLKLYHMANRAYCLQCIR